MRSRLFASREGNTDKGRRAAAISSTVCRRAFRLQDEMIDTLHRKSAGRIAALADAHRSEP
jgi:hypothetical protein